MQIKTLLGGFVARIAHDGKGFHQIIVEHPEIGEIMLVTYPFSPRECPWGVVGFGVRALTPEDGLAKAIEVWNRPSDPFSSAYARQEALMTSSMGVFEGD